MRVWVSIVLIVILLSGCGRSNLLEPRSIQHRNKHKVIVLVVDSLTNRAIHRAMNRTDCKAIQYLVRKGQYTSNIVASFPAMSVSDIATLVTGAPPDKHRIPGLVWFDTKRNVIVNYGNNFWKTMKLGTRNVSQHTLYNLNQKHLSQYVETIFEELQDDGYSTGAINILIYRGRKLHKLTLPLYTRPFTGTDSYIVKGPDTLVFGRLTSSFINTRKASVLHKLGMNDEFATDALLELVKQNKLPDFTMVYLPSNDSIMHKHGVDAIKGVTEADKDIQKVLNAYGTWDRALQRVTFIVMGDGGVTSIWPKDKDPSIFLKDSLNKYAIYRWGAC